MEQLTQNLKNGEMKLLEVPYPALSAGQVLIRNYYSLISAGTEGKTVKDARLGYLAKARARREEVKKVIRTARTIGLSETYRLVMNRLDAPSALGYSCAGIVIAVADDVTEFKIGDTVACGGSSAVHAEVVSVPVNLCVKTDASVHPEFACFTTIGAIAMQGIRQADLRLGENAVVIGLGLIGQLTMQLLKASGIKAAGIDVDPAMVELADKCGAPLSVMRNREDLEEQIHYFTNGHGTDAVIITAATSNTDPVDLAGSLCRKKGKVIIVGAVPTGFNRKNYYIKELELKMSGSYGPGRYDSEYEEKGIDYPYAYVRWTENRNMQAFAELIKSGQINLTPLITHVFDFKNAPQAYNLILERSETFAAVLLRYDVTKELNKSVRLHNRTTPVQSPVIGMIGAGSFGQNFLLPSIKETGAYLKTIATARPNNARNVADKFGFEYCTGDANEIFSNPEINTVFIATRHDSHAEFVLKSLENNKNVFTEKPLCLNIDELDAIKNSYSKSDKQVCVGFNRRYAPLIQEIKKHFKADIPVAVQYRINAGRVDPSHWIHDPETGGGRIIGEVCHFIDLCSFIASSPIEYVSAIALQDPGALSDTLSISLGMKNGSIASISYFSNGHKDLGKEYLEVFSGGSVVILDDFSKLNIKGKKSTETKIKQDKGHKQTVKYFIDSIKNGTAAPLDFNSIYNSMMATFKVCESVKANGQRIVI